VSEQQEKIQNANKNVIVKGYQLYYVAATPVLGKDHHNYTSESYWCLKLCLIGKQISGSG
jgi:hypothetical protein